MVLSPSTSASSSLLFSKRVPSLVKGSGLGKNVRKSVYYKALSMANHQFASSRQFSQLSSVSRQSKVSKLRNQFVNTSVRYNSNSQGPEPELTDSEAQEVLKSMKLIWNNPQLTEQEKSVELNNLFLKSHIRGLISPNSSKLVRLILLDESAVAPGEKMNNVQNFHKALLNFDKMVTSSYDNEQLKDHFKVFEKEYYESKGIKKGEDKDNENNENKENKDNENNNNDDDKSTSEKKSAQKPQVRFEFGSKGDPKLANDPAYTEIKINLSQVLIYLSAAGLVYYLLSSESHDREITWQDFRTSLLDKRYVEKLVVMDNNIVKVVLNQNGKNQPIHDSKVEYFFTIGSVDIFEEKLEKAQDDAKVPDELRVPVIYSSSVSVIKTLFRLAPSLLFLFLIWQSRKLFTGGAGGAGGLFGGNQKKFKKFNAEQNIKINFDDVAGCDEAKEEIMEFVKFLKNPKKYEQLGAKIPRGAILSGPPGTGKTLLAKATAGEAGVPFYSVSGSEFVEMFVGVGASRVRELFKTARENAPSIIFVDEIDAIGKSRSKGKVSGGNDERENTLNQLLVEMDGFQTGDHVVVLAGTNRADVLDQALLRPGRFDRKVYVDNPELEGRKSIFKVHLKKIKLSKDTELEDLVGRLSTLTPGFSGADIANVCNEAALIAVRNERTSVILQDFEQAIERVIAGLEKKSKLLSPEEKKIVAFHEAGHAICGWYLEHADPLLKVSIVPRGQGALGYAQYLPADISLYSTQKLLDRLTMIFGGRVSEEMHFDSVTSGASDDFEKATNVAQRMVLECGMSPKIGFINYSQERDNDMSKPFSDKTAALIDSEIHRIIDESYTRCRNLLEEKKHEVDLVANELLTKEVITREDMVRLLGKRPFPNKNDAFDKYLEAKEAKEEAKTSDDAAPDEGSDKDIPPAATPPTA